MKIYFCVKKTASSHPALWFSCFNLPWGQRVQELHKQRIIKFHSWKPQGCSDHKTRQRKGSALRYNRRPDRNKQIKHPTFFFFLSTHLLMHLWAEIDHHWLRSWSPEAKHRTRIMDKWLFKEVIPRKTGKGMGTWDRQGEEDWQGCHLRQVPQKVDTPDPTGSSGGSGTPPSCPPGRKKAGLAHSCTNQALAKGCEGA